MGRIVDLLVDETGKPRAAIIDFGGFLGVGIRKIAIDWHTLRFEAEGTGGRRRRSRPRPDKGGTRIQEFARDCRGCNRTGVQAARYRPQSRLVIALT
jgi:hypothetical protein